MIINPPISKKIVEVLKSHDCFSLFVHENPDCDALGSASALMLSLQKLGKQAKIIGINEATFNTYGNLFPINVEPVDVKYINKSVGIIFDTSNQARVQAFNNPEFKFVDTIRFDHHIIVESFAHHEWLDVKAAATCEIIGWLILNYKLPIDNQIISCLYAGLLTDTGKFSFPSTSETTFKLMSELAAYDFDRQAVLDKLFLTSWDDNKINNLLRKKIKITPEGAGYILLNKRTSNRIGAEKLRDKVWLMAGINEIKIWCYVYYDAGLNTWKGSLRSRKYDVNQIARQFNGGGHLLASGFKLESPKQIKDLKAAVQKVLNA